MKHYVVDVHCVNCGKVFRRHAQAMAKTNTLGNAATVVDGLPFCNPDCLDEYESLQAFTFDLAIPLEAEESAD